MIKLNQEKFKLNKSRWKTKIINEARNKYNKRRSGSSADNKKKIIKQEDGFVV